MANRYKIVLLAAAFSLLFEYSMRGIGGLFRSGFFLLFFLYCSYYSLVEDLIVRYRITNKQLLVVAFCFGVVPEAFLTGAIFAPPLNLGVNIARFFFINIVWWGCLQGLVTFYFATRIVQRDWNHRTLGYFGWGIRLAYIAGVSVLTFFRSPVLPRGPLTGYIIVFFTIALGVVYLKHTLKSPQQDVYAFRKSALLDFLSFGSVFVFLGLGTFVATTQTLVEGSLLNLLASQVSTVWTVIVFCGVVIYYVHRRKQITI
ncbi:MAG: hypothetical protein HXS46_06185 [Theionarchaea archaeon]|nr:MAG: hypothetical protein AYK18_12130 [Theionarchaea archaeon DG-70]MBU7010261.1 hypothetical protein [Theionarchaea archaeon]